MRKVKILGIVLGIICIYQGCKVGEDDPLISFRSRDKRLIGTWFVRQHLIDTHYADYLYRFQKNGEVYYSAMGNTPRTYYGIWRWASEDQSTDRKESIIIHTYNQVTEQYFFTKLSYKKLEFYFVYDTGLPDKKTKRTYTRVE